MRELPDAGDDATGVPSAAMFDDDAPESGRTLSVRLDVQLDAQPITGRLRTDGGEDEQFVGWLGFIDTLRRLSGEVPPGGDSEPSRP